MSAPLIKLGEKAYLFGGYTKEQPVYLSDYWVNRVIVVIANNFIPSIRSHTTRQQVLDLAKMTWSKVTPTVQLPLVNLPIGRYGHSMLPIPNLQTIIMFGGQSGLQRKNFSLSMKTSAEVTNNFISGVWL
jgi:hypothetical protein